MWGEFLEGMFLYESIIVDIDVILGYWWSDLIGWKVGGGSCSEGC